jgi:hypothetical protein
MPQRLLLLLAALMLSFAPITAAQNPTRSLRPEFARALWSRSGPESVPRREPLGGFLGPDDEDYRYAGFFVGAALGLAATAFSLTWCSDADNACSTGRVLLVGPVVSAALGLGGAVLGGLLPKTAPGPS